MAGIGEEIRALLMKPVRVLVLSLGLAAILVLYDGSLFRFMAVQKAKEQAEVRISQVRKANEVLDGKIRQTRSSEFLNKQAREQLDLVREDEMVFVFTNDSNDLDQEAP